MRDEAAHDAGAVIGVEVAAAQRGWPTGPDHVAADDRAAATVAGVAVGEDRLGRAAGIGSAAVFFFVGVEALESVPAEVGAAGTGEGRVVKLLEAILADVADRDSRLPGGDRVEGEAERIAQAVGVDLVATRPADEGVVGRDRVWASAARARVDAQQLAQQAFLVLGVAGWVAAGAAVAGAEIEQVAEELQLTAVVVGVDRMGDLDHVAACAPVGPGRAGALQFVDADV